jgi:hypothetical protein
MIASIIKTVQLKAITAEADLTYAMAELAIWWTLEAYLVLIATSIPTLRPIIKPSGQPRGRFRPKGLGSSSRSSAIRVHFTHNGAFERMYDPQLLDTYKGHGDNHHQALEEYPLQTRNSGHSTTT